MKYRRARRVYRKKGVTKSVKRYVAKAIDRSTENKQVYQTLASNWGSVGNSWIEVNLCNPAQGLTETTRIGRKIRIKSINLRGIMVGGQTNTVADDKYNVVRIIIGLYTYGPSGSNVLNTAGATISQPITKNWNTKGMLIKKFYDKYITLPVAGLDSTGYVGLPKQWKYFKRLGKGILVNYADDSSSYPNKAIVMSVISDSTAVANPGFISGYGLISYEDA